MAQPAHIVYHSSNGASIHAGRWPGGRLTGNVVLDAVTAAGLLATGPSEFAGNVTLADVQIGGQAGDLPLPSYVPITVGEAAVITTTNSLAAVRPLMPGGVAGPAMGIGDYSGGAANRWASPYGKHLVHGGGHAISDDSSIYAVAYGAASVSWECLAAAPNLQDTGHFYDYAGTGSEYSFGTSYGYFVSRGAASTDPANPTNAAGYERADDENNPRECAPGWPGSCHSYDTLAIIPPDFCGDPHGALIRNGAFAVSRVASRTTFWSHVFGLSGTTWAKYAGTTNFSRSTSIDLLRGRAVPYGVPGYRDLATGAWVVGGGSITGLPAGYDDNHFSEYHPVRDIHAYVTNTQAESDAGAVSKWAWWVGGATTGARNLVTWAAGAPPNVATPGKTGQASLVFVDDVSVRKLCYYTRADQDAYYLIDVPVNPADPWSWTRIAITGAGRPSLLASPHQNVYRRMDWLPALKCLSYIPLSSDTGATLNQAVLIRVAS